MKLKAFEALIIKHPRDLVELAGQEFIKEEDSILIKGPITILATDQDQAKVLAGREIPQEEMKSISRIEVLVRNF